MINAWIHNVYIVTALFTSLFILLKKIAYISFIHDAKAFAFAKNWYYWLEMMFVLLWVLLTPQHTFDEALVVIMLCMIIKLLAGQLTFLDRFINSIFGKQ